MTKNNWQRIIKIAVLPVILISLFLIVDFRIPGALEMMSILGTSLPQSVRGSNADLLKFFQRQDVKHLSEEERLLVSQFLNHYSDSKEWSKKLCQMAPQNPMYQAFYTTKLCNNIYNDRNKVFASTPENRTKLKLIEEQIARGRELEPENALYDYLEFQILTEQAMSWNLLTHKGIRNGMQSSWTTTEYQIHDADLLEKALLVYQAGLSKPYVKTYSVELSKQATQLMKNDHALYDLLQRLQINASTELSHLTIMRNISSKVAFCAANFNYPEHKNLLPTWRRILYQMLENNSNCLVEILVYSACADRYLQSAEKLKDEKEAAALKDFLSIINDWKAKPDKANELIKRHGGILSGMLLPALKEDIPPENFNAERRATYRAFDILVTMLSAIEILLFILIYAIIILWRRIRQDRAVWILLPGKSYLNIGIYGVLLPYGLFFILTHIDAISGRDVSLQKNMNLFLLFSTFLLLIPFWFQCVCLKEFKKFAKASGFPDAKTPSASLALNMLIFFSALLLLSGLFIRPALSMEFSYYIRHDPLFSVDYGFTSIENKVTAELASGQLKQIKKTLEK